MAVAHPPVSVERKVAMVRITRLDVPQCYRILAKLGETEQ